MTTLKKETLRTDNFESRVYVRETDKERLKIFYELWRVNYIHIPLINKKLRVNMKRIDYGYYGPPHKTCRNTDDAIKVFDSCKEYMSERMKTREKHRNELG